MAKLRAPLWRQNQLIDVMLPFGLALRHWLPFRRFLGRAIARRYPRRRSDGRLGHRCRRLDGFRPMSDQDSKPTFNVFK